MCWPLHHNRHGCVGLPLARLPLLYTGAAGEGNQSTSNTCSATRGKPDRRLRGRYETLADDFRTVCQHIGLGVSIPHLNQSRHRDYREYCWPARRPSSPSCTGRYRAVRYTFEGRQRRLAARSPNRQPGRASSADGLSRGIGRRGRYGWKDRGARPSFAARSRQGFPGPPVDAPRGVGHLAAEGRPALAPGLSGPANAAIRSAELVRRPDPARRQPFSRAQASVASAQRTNSSGRGCRSPRRTDRHNRQTAGNAPLKCRFRDRFFGGARLASKQARPKVLQLLE